MTNTVSEGLPAHQNVSIHFLEEEAIVFEREAQSLFAVNSTAAAVWCGLEQKFPPNQVAAGLSERFGIDVETARSYVADVLRQWRRARHGDESIHFDIIKHDGDAELLERKLIEKPKDFDVQQRHRLLDTLFVLRYRSFELATLTEQVLGHLDDHKEASMHRAVLDIGPFDDGFAVSNGNDVLAYCSDINQVASMVKAAMIERSLSDADEFCAVHAAAVVRDNVCILLPGETGAGKSCLAAGLLAEGFELLGDDTAVLSHDGLCVRPLPFGICVKANGSDVLSSRFPALKGLDFHDRADGKRVQYITPPEVQLAGLHSRLPVDYIVFPRYSAEGGTEMFPINTMPAIRKLLKCFFPLGEDLGSEDVDRLIDWIDQTTCFDLRFSNLTDAVNRLSRLEK